MSKDPCPRCGYQSRCIYGTWPDRHPFYAVAGSLFALVFLAMMLSVYAAAGWSVIAVCAGMYLWNRLDREHERRQALADRADWEHSRLMELAPVPPRRSWTSAVTAPLRMGRIAR